MGIPIEPHPPERSEFACITCEDLNWGVGNTPKSLDVVFHGVEACPGQPDPPIRFPITCTQDPNNPCEYNAYFEFGGYNWWAWLLPEANGIWLYRISNGGLAYFFGQPGQCLHGPCGNHCDCIASYGRYGTASIMGIPNDLILKLALDYNLQPDKLGLYDIFDSATPGDKIVRLTGRECSGSCLLRYSPP